jgi:hypothetical protein
MKSDRACERQDEHGRHYDEAQFQERRRADILAFAP